MTALADKVVFVLADTTVKATLLLALAALGAAVSRRASAGFRHLLWTLGLGCILALPLFSMLLPQWRIPVQAAVTHEHPAPLPMLADPLPSQAEQNNPSVLPPADSAPPIVPLPAAVSSAPIVPRFVHPTRLQWSVLVLLVWVAGATAVLARLCFGLLSLRSIRKFSTLVRDDSLIELLALAIRALPTRRRVELRVSTLESVSVPLTWGALRPVIVLPANVVDWPHGRTRAALLHELSHVRRQDWLLQAVGHLACALYWFNPFVWLAVRAMRIESERACDDMALSSGIDASDYAGHLLDVALGWRDERRRGSAAVAMAQTPKIERRLRAILDQTRVRRPITMRTASLALCAALFIVFPLSALRPVARAQVLGKSSMIRRQTHGFLKFVYLKDVATGQYPSRPWSLIQEPDGHGGTIAELTETKTKYSRRLPEGKDIQASFGNLTAQGVKPRPFTKFFSIPPPLSHWTPLRKVYFTTDQRENSYTLADEYAAWRKRETARTKIIANSPVIVTDADIKPNVSAFFNNQVPPMPTVDINFTFAGAKKMANFTAMHRGEIMGIFLDGKLFEAPVINGPISTEGEISGGFKSLAEAQVLAARLNNHPTTSAVDTDNAASHIALGLKLQQQGQSRDGIPEFRRAVQLDPNNAEAQFQLAQALYEIQWKRFSTPQKHTDVVIPTAPASLNEAILHMRKAVSLRPADAWWHSTLGTYLADSGRDAEAVPEFRQALHLFDPVNPPDVPQDIHEPLNQAAANIMSAHDDLGDSLLKLKQYNLAVQQYQQALRFYTSDNALLGLGDALRGAGRRSEARAAWKKVVALDGVNFYYGRLADKRLIKYR